MLAALGLFVFEAATFPFAELAARADWRHASAPRVGARDASQYIGPGEETISLPGALLPEAGASFGAIATLRAMAEEGEAWPFIDGGGTVWGSYIIVSMDQRRRAMLVDGTPRVIDFTLELRRVG